MSEASRRARQERRAVEREVDEARIRAVALVADGGGYRVATLALPVSALEAWAVTITEPEVLSIQAPIAAAALEDGARGDIDEDGRSVRPRCPSCGVEAMVRHPSKPAMLCAACGHREALAP